MPQHLPIRKCLILTSGFKLSLLTLLTNRQLFLRHLAQTSDAPLMLEIERAEGIYMYAPNGKRYIDLISGIGVSNVGHRHPKVVAAIESQLGKYMHLMVYGEYVQSPQVILAQKLAATTLSKLDQVYFVNSGTEAIEGVMKVAKRSTGRSEFVSCEKAYHGSTHGALSIGGGEYFKQAYRPLLPGMSQIRYGNIDDLEIISCRTAAVIIETVQGEAGVQFAGKAYFQALRDRCTFTGTLLILDEIQCGFGRTGTFWAYEQTGIVPDMLVTAKGMGGGLPIGAFLAKEEVMACIKTDPFLGHLTTFGGNPVCCAASLGVFEALETENLLSKVKQKEHLFRSLLVHPLITAFRSQGLMMAAEMPDFFTLKKVIDLAIEHGVVTDWFLYCDNSMRLAPPLIISESEIREVCKILLACMDKVMLDETKQS